ncbi:MAG: thioredoxin domain-containing protein [Burkholderiales bacterium]
MTAAETLAIQSEDELDTVARLLASDHSTGGAHARVHLLEYGDYESASCSEAEQETRHLIEVFGHRLRFTYRHFPLAEHLRAEATAEAAEAAAAQDRFWPMHHLLFAHWQDLERDALTQCAEQAGLDMPPFTAAMDEHAYRERVQEHWRSGELIGLHGSPSFFLNGKVVDVSFGLAHLERAIRATLGER